MSQAHATGSGRRFALIKPLTNSFAVRSGLFDEINRLIVEHPGRRLPTKNLGTKYKVSGNTVLQIANAIEDARDMPHKRTRGGPNTALPQEVINVIKQVYRNAVNGEKISVLRLLEHIARQTGKCISVSSVRTQVALLEKSGKKNVVLSSEGMPPGLMKYGRVEQLRNLLAQKGIHSEPFINRGAWK